jgi:hypothetical protein
MTACTAGWLRHSHRTYYIPFQFETSSSAHDTFMTVFMKILLIDESRATRSGLD